MTSYSKKSRLRNPFERLSGLRKELGLTREEMGKLLEVTGNYVYLLESGRKTPSDKVITRLDNLEKRAALRSGDEPLVLRDEPAPYGREKVHSITTKSQLASACAEHFIQFLKSIGDQAAPLEETLLKLREEFPVTKPAEQNPTQTGTPTKKNIPKEGKD